MTARNHPTTTGTITVTSDHVFVSTESTIITFGIPIGLTFLRGVFRSMHNFTDTNEKKTIAVIVVVVGGGNVCGITTIIIKIIFRRRGRERNSSSMTMCGINPVVVADP